MGRSWGRLEAILGRLGPSLGDLGGVLGRLGGILGRLGGILGRLGAILGRLRALLGRSWAPKNLGDTWVGGRGVGPTRYLPKVNTLDFEEIERLYSLNE